MTEVRKPFIYVAAIAVVLGLIGVFMISGSFSGNVVSEPENLALYSQSQIQEHDNPGDCWISTNSYVYDITMAVNSIQELKSLENNCGNNIDLSQDSINLIKVYKIGKLG